MAQWRGGAAVWFYGMHGKSNWLKPLVVEFTKNGHSERSWVPILNVSGVCAAYLTRKMVHVTIQDGRGATISGDLCRIERHNFEEQLEREVSCYARVSGPKHILTVLASFRFHVEEHTPSRKLSVGRTCQRALKCP